MMKGILLFCLLVTTVFTNSFAQLTINTVTQNVSCYGLNDGSATVTASGCSGNYTYQWSPNVSSSNAAANLVPGTYIVTVSSGTTGIAGTDTLFNDDFDGGSSKWTLNASSGTNDAQANKWVIDDYESWDGVCGSGNLASSGDKTLHVYCNSSYCGMIGTGAIYDAGGLLTKTTADVYSYTSADINTTGYSNITLKFAYRSYGQNNKDYGSIRYSADAGQTWTDLTTKYQLQTNWDCETVILPSDCENISTLRIAFRWRNNNDGSGKDPAFAIDDVVITGETQGSVACSATDTFAITEPSLFAVSAGADQTICSGSSTTLSVSGGSIYSWSSSPNDPSLSGQQNAGSPIVSPQATTTYMVSATNENGCQSNDTIIVNTTSANIIAAYNTISGADTICPGDTLGLIAWGGLSFSWTPSATLTDANSQMPYSFPLVTTTYTVTGTDNNGCQGSGSIQVNVYPAPVVPVITQQNDTLFTQTGYQYYTWYYNGSPISNASSYYYVPQISGNYYVGIVDKNGCIAKSIVEDVGVVTIMEAIDNESAILIYPNPNQGEFTINFTTGDYNKISIRDVLGREVYVEPIISQQQHSIKLKNVNPGIYSLCLSNNNGKFTIQKIVIEK